MFITTRGLVLRETKYKEADKILTVLTESEGKLTVRARGALRKNSKVGAASQQCVFSEMTLFESKGRWSLNEAVTLEEYRGLREELPLLALGAYICELLEAVTDEDSPNPELLRLGLNMLFALSRSLCPQKQVKAAFELRLMCLAGYEPSVGSCGVCGAEEPNEPVFEPDSGMLRCEGCIGERSLRLCGDSVAAMRYIISSPSKRMLSFELPEAALDRLSTVCERYALTQLERGFQTLDYYKSLLP